MNASVQELLAHTDLTLLKDNISDAELQRLQQLADSPLGTIASLCLPIDVLSRANDLFNHAIPLCTVANFPEGKNALLTVLKHIEMAKNAGAAEIDIVMPYQRFLNNDIKFCEHFINACKRECEQHQLVLKIILETGALPNSQSIYTASQIAIASGADFIKTSTGKIQTGATIEAAQQMLNAILKHNIHCGIKLSGGIRTLKQATEYLTLIDNTMPAHWRTAQTVRIGTSKLIEA